jgi:hypothetical protein
MKVTLENTSKIVEINLGRAGAMPARIWEGHTDSGIPVHCYVTRIAVGREQDQTQFEAELQHCRAPSPEVAAIPLRLII